MPRLDRDKLSSFLTTTQQKLSWSRRYTPLQEINPNHHHTTTASDSAEMAPTSKSRSSRVRKGEDHKRYLSAKKASASLRRRIDTLVAMIPRKTKQQKKDIDKLLRKCEKDLEAQEAGNLALFDHLPFKPKKAPRASSIPAKVFAVPEILENILIYLPSSNLLNAHHVNKTFRDTIQGSTKLQRALGLTPHPESDFFIPTLNFTRIMRGIHMRGPERWLPSELKDTNLNEVKIQFETMSLGRRSTFKSANLGPRCAAMLVTQPPIREMQVYAHCCTHPPDSFAFNPFSLLPTRPSRAGPTMTIRSWSGITVGQVFEAFSEVRKTHCLCPEASELDYDADGFVRSKITIEGTASLSDDDPLVCARRLQLRQAKIDKQKEDERQRQLRRYRAAKQAAHANGNPIPTLAELEATQQADAS